MAGKILSQTRYAIQAMKDAGFARSDFRARTERHYIGRHPDTGKVMYEYGRCIVTMRCKRSEYLTDDKIRAMLNTGLLDVTEFRRKDSGELVSLLVKSGAGNRRVIRF